MNNEYDRYLNEIVLCESGKKYTITKYVSEGGNGFVFECVDEKENIYILKILHTTNSIKIANFKKEIELQKRVNSKYIVKCIDSGEQLFGEQRKQRPFYIMEKYDSSLETLINNDYITPVKAYKYILQLCEGLKVLHKRKEPIIHGDLKPENILYDSKKDSVLICDFGLAHLSSNNTTINNGFAGNIDYHAPEQKIRGKQQVGTYTDIYSLGLIINVLFTKEIAQGESYKKIWQCSPYFSFLDDCVDRMIKHDINQRENDIDSIIFELEEHEFEYEVEESFIKTICKNKGLPSSKVAELMNLFSLMEFTVKNYSSWSGVNLNYLCDYHFCCDDVMINSLFINNLYYALKKKFEYEANVYEGSKIPYETIDIEDEINKQLYFDFANKIDALIVIDEVEHKKNIIKKYFLSLCDYHAREILKEIERLQSEINYYCCDAPAMYISYYVSTKLPVFRNSNNRITKYVSLLKYEESNVTDKNVFYKDPNEEIKEAVKKIKELIPNASSLIGNVDVKIWFDSLKDERCFESIVQKAANSYDEKDVRRQDLLDILIGIDSSTLKMVYKLDSYTVPLLLKHL